MRTWAAASSCGAALCVAAAAHAAPVRKFDIPPKAYSEALIDLALQGDVSLLGASACGGFSRTPLRGRYTVEEALRRLLADAPCVFRMADERTVRVTPAPVAPPASAVRPASPTVAPPPLSLSEITVTAAKRREAADHLATAISVLPGEILDLASVADPGQAGSHVAGLLTTNLGPGRDKILLRGLSDGAFTGRARSTVATVLDESPINYAAPDPDLRLVDVERVEVVRGPQGALYGAGALGGVFRIVTRKPDLHHARGGLEVSYGWGDDASPSSVVEGFASIPLVEGKLGVRLAGYREVRGGYLDNVDMRRSDVDETSRGGLRVALRYAPNDAWTVDLSGALQDLRSNDSQYSTDTGSPMLRDSALAERHDNHFAQAALTVRGRFGWGELTSSTSYVRHSYHSHYDATLGWAVVGFPETTLAVNHELTQYRMLVQDVVITSNAGGPISWLAGVYGVASGEDTTSALDVSWPGFSGQETYEERRRDKMREGAVYGEASWAFAPRWRLSVGGRVFVTKIDIRSHVHQEAPYLPRVTSYRHSFSGFTPKVVLERTVGQESLVYALYSEGYRPGGLNTAGLAEPWEPWSTYEDDRLHSFEIGGKTTAFSKRLSLQGAVFFERWNEIQSDQFLWPTGFTYTTNVGDADLLGLEIEGAYDTGWGLSVKGNALLTASRVMDANPWYALQIVRDLPGTPTFSGGALAIYERPVGGGGTLRLLADLSYVGRSNLSFDAYLSPRMGDFLRSRLAVQLLRGAWRGEFYVSNPTNSRANTFAYGNPWSLGLVNQATPLRPRTFGVGLSAAF